MYNCDIIRYLLRHADHVDAKIFKMRKAHTSSLVMFDILAILVVAGYININKRLKNLENDKRVEDYVM